MPEVFLHVYDVTSTGNEKTNNAIVKMNKIFRDGIGLGGIFHSAVEVYDEEEWSFGYCERGSGVFVCSRKQNPMYTYRESLSLGHINLSYLKVDQILTELRREWLGCSYELLSRNCNHFCNEFCERLGVQKIPGWINRFANAGDVAVEVAETTMKGLKQAKTEIASASRVAYQFMFGNASTSTDPSASGNGGGLLSLPLFKSIALSRSSNNGANDCLSLDKNGNGLISSNSSSSNSNSNSNRTTSSNSSTPVVGVEKSGGGAGSLWSFSTLKNSLSSSNDSDSGDEIDRNGKAASLLKLPSLKNMMNRNRLGTTTTEENTLVHRDDDKH